MAHVMVGIGSNLNRYRHITAALNALQRHAGQLMISHIYQSKPVGLQSNDFLNGAVAFYTQQSINQLVTLLRQIEYDNGRQRHGRANNHACTLDIDLLTYDNFIGTAANNTPLPREAMLQYAFVLKPVTDIAPTRVHPVLQRSYQQLWQGFNQPDQSLKGVPFLWRDNKL